MGTAWCREHVITGGCPTLTSFQSEAGAGVLGRWAGVGWEGAMGILRPQAGSEPRISNSHLPSCPELGSEPAGLQRAPVPVPMLIPIPQCLFSRDVKWKIAVLIEL